MRVLLLSLAGLLAGSSAARATSAVLVGQLDVSPQYQYTDVWGWSDAQTGRAYALVGNNASGMHIVDVTDPSNPYGVSKVMSVPRFDMKTWGSLVYTVDGLTGPGGIVDIANPSSPLVVGTFPGGHNIFIDHQGFLYVCQPGLKVYNLNPDPTAPTFAWGYGTTDGHDAAVVGDILYEFRGYAGTVVWDVSDRYDPVPYAWIADPIVDFHHNGWPSKDGRYLFITNEYALGSTPDITVWDIQDSGPGELVGQISDPTSSVHNLYVIGDLMFVAYYTSGFRVYDVSDPTQPALADEYDTSAFSGEGIFEGAWGCYPFGPGANVYINDRPNGLFVFRIDTPTGVRGTPARAPGLVVGPAVPNPFAHSTTVRYSQGTSGTVEIAVYDAAGRLMKRLEGNPTAAGDHDVQWDGLDRSGRPAPSGIYFLRVRAGGAEEIRKLVLVR